HADAIKRGYVEIPPWMPTGASPVKFMFNRNAFEADRVLAVYCVHVDTEDIHLLKKNNVSVCITPRANAHLGMGVAPLSEILSNELTVGLGSDSPASTNSTDLFSEMRIGMLVQRSVDPKSFISPEKMLYLATLGGASALGLADKIGSLEVGKHADMVAVDFSEITAAAFDPIAAMVNNCYASDVMMTMVDGVVRYEKNKWHVDVEVAKNVARIIEIKRKLRA
ncbi:MAG: amidohydrolase family protein, partial [Eggerthellaceae bacterium]|nr:amidohydrolase family protein [Eggerthellaceae bacterium]